MAEDRAKHLAKYKKMKIAIVSHSLSKGGAERVAVVLANGLAERKHNVVVIVEEHNTSKVDLNSSIKLIVLEGNSRVVRLCKLTRVLRRERFEIVHTITPFLTLQALTARIFVRIWNTKVIGAYHGYGHFSSSHGILSYLSYLLTPIVTRLADKNICVSDTLKGDLIDHWGAKSNNLVTIYNPVLVPILPVAMSRHSSDVTISLPPEYILYVGRLSKEKNPMLALRAFALLPERFSRLSLILLGEGPLRGALGELAHKLNICRRVVFENYAVDPWKYYVNAKVVISTSNRESFSLVIVEAMACGLPVVSTSSGGPEEILAGGRFGFLVPIDDDKSLAAGIMHAIDNPPSREMLRNRASEFSVDRALNAYECLFSSVFERAVKTSC